MPDGANKGLCRQRQGASARRAGVFVTTASVWVGVFASGCGPEPFRFTPDWVLPKAVHVSPWVPMGEPNTYDPNTLEEYIDGAARPYREYGFNELIHATYARRDNTRRQMTVDIYEMLSPLAAYGIYSAQRPEKAEEVRLGTAGFWSEGQLSFVKERFFVTIQSPGDSVGDMAGAMMLGGYIDGRMTLSAMPPGQLAVFPPNELIANSQKYLARNMLGHEFLGSGWQASYRYRGVVHSLFFILCQDSPAALQSYEKLAEYVAANGRIVRQVPGIGRAAMVGTGESIGRIFVVCGRAWLVGSVDCFDDDRSTLLCRQVLENLEQMESE
jgi:hypothetical protein